MTLKEEPTFFVWLKCVPAFTRLQEIFESFFGTHNPFVDFGFGDTMPFASRLKKQGPRKPDAVVRNLECSLDELYNGCSKVVKITRKVCTGKQH